jgi:tRNA(fMet)-specific endonuclease VapC
LLPQTSKTAPYPSRHPQKCIAWGSKEAAAYGKLRAQLEAAGTVLSELDLLIAAHAIAVGAVLVTNDKALARIKDLHGTQNWATDI